MALPVITLAGNTTADAELRYTQKGLAIANFTIAANERIKDRDTGEFRDGDSLFVRCSVMGDKAEAVAGALTKGIAVVATGKLKQRSYETKEGEKRTSLEMDVYEVGVAVRANRNGSQETTSWSTATPPAQTVSYGDETPF